MKLNIKDFVTLTLAAFITFSVITMSSCGKKDDDEAAAAAPVNALALSMNANCDGDPCM